MLKPIRYLRRLLAEIVLAKAKELHAGAALELDCPGGTTVHAFGTLHTAVADLLAVISEMIWVE